MLTMKNVYMTSTCMFEHMHVNNEKCVHDEHMDVNNEKCVHDEHMHVNESKYYNGNFPSSVMISNH